MAPENNYNPFNSPEFRKEMSDMFDDKLGGLTSTQEDHGKRIVSLERWRWLIIGGGLALGFLVELWAKAAK